MLRMSQISINALSTNSKGIPKLEFEKNHSNLNKVLFSQLLQKHRMLNNDDIVQIQMYSSFLAKTEQKTLRRLTKQFAIFENV